MSSEKRKSTDTLSRALKLNSSIKILKITNPLMVEQNYHKWV